MSVTLRFDEVEVGAELTALEIPVTTTLVVAGAIASRDYQDVHHDPELAKQKGSKDIFMNILTTNGFVGRFITDWAGPEAQLRSIAIRLGVPAVPNLTLRFRGQVVDTTEKENERELEVALQAANDLGNHVTGTVTLTLPH